MNVVAPAPYQVEAYNTLKASENKISTTMPSRAASASPVA